MDIADINERPDFFIAVHLGDGMDCIVKLMAYPHKMNFVIHVAAIGRYLTALKVSGFEILIVHEQVFLNDDQKNKLVTIVQEYLEVTLGTYRSWQN